MFCFLAAHLVTHEMCRACVQVLFSTPALSTLPDPQLLVVRAFGEHAGERFCAPLAQVCVCSSCG